MSTKVTVDNCLVFPHYLQLTAFNQNYLFLDANKIKNERIIKKVNIIL